jgi:Rrf2 family protein
MFNLSAKGDYGLVFLRELAKLPKGQYLGLKEMAKAHNLPFKYLEQLARKLTQAGIVVSREGKGGGYTLAKKPSAISLIKILVVLEGELSPAICAAGCDLCSRQQACEKKTGWHKIHQQLYKTVSKYTLADALSNPKK